MIEVFLNCSLDIELAISSGCTPSPYLRFYGTRNTVTVAVPLTISARFRRYGYVLKGHVINDAIERKSQKIILFALLWDRNLKIWNLIEVDLTVGKEVLQAAKIGYKSFSKSLDYDFRNLNNVNDIEFFRSESDKTSIFKSLMTDLGHGKRIFKADKLSALLISKQLKENRVPTKYFSCQTQSADNWDAEYLSAPPNTDSSDPKDDVILFNGEVIEISVTATVYGTSVAVQEPYLYGRMPYTVRRTALVASGTFCRSRIQIL
ncbi:hypothetical protein BDQ12DRAFT_715623 [Crucibulum laeve]|uniref:Uncharacterized protein n=1 Tax=Crucibulum laeve TaxID=68775 RepID=A0A5C3LNK6_9AGAR|nr:hypothetical protein BDQ12DRAFT_715623 [Crucibulum laeve]